MLFGRHRALQLTVISRFHSSSHALATVAGELVRKRGQCAHAGVESLGRKGLGTSTLACPPSLAGEKWL